MFLMLSIRLVDLQGIQHRTLHDKAKRQHERQRNLPAKRGNIYDRNGNMLATSTHRPSVYATLPALRDPETTLIHIAPGLRSDALAQRLQRNKHRSFAWLYRKTDPESAIRLQQVEGIKIQMEDTRIYPNRTLLGQVLGFTDIDQQGLEGIEEQYDQKLRGQTLQRQVWQDALGRPILEVRPEQAHVHGDDLYLTIDESIQHISQRELMGAVRRNEAKGGVVIVMNPHNGEILALAVAPEFNPNPSRLMPSAWRNRAIADLYEPGSTFKIVTAAAALDAGMIRPETLVNCEQGAYRFSDLGAVIHDHHPVGVVTFREAMARSSNICMVKVARRLGAELLLSYIQAFGFGAPLGIDLAGEAAGKIRPIERWSKRSLASVAIGQEIGVTPIQMAAAMSVIANGGQRVVPRLGLYSCEEERCAQPTQVVISYETAHEMTHILKGVVSQTGTGTSAAILGFTVAGKTGTAQKWDAKLGRYATDRHVSSFVGFVPADNPAVVILVIIDEPQGKGWGGTVAAPVFSRIGAQTLHRLRIRPDRPQPEQRPLPMREALEVTGQEKSSG